jgi:hypothetical protein
MTTGTGRVGIKNGVNHNFKSITFGNTEYGGGSPQFFA